MCRKKAEKGRVQKDVPISTKVMKCVKTRTERPKRACTEKCVVKHRIVKMCVDC